MSIQCSLDITTWNGWSASVNNALDPDEVEAAVWEPWAAFRDSVLDGSREISPWCREQVVLLPADPLHAPQARAATATRPLKCGATFSAKSSWFLIAIQ